MALTATPRQVFVARLAVAAVAAGVVLGLFWYGLSTDVLARIGQDIAARPSGPMMFRFILQPLMAAIAAFHDGAKDVRLHRSPYLWTLLNGSGDRPELFGEGVLATARVILLGLVMDGVYQVIVLDTFYPGEMAIVAILLAFVPYVLLRGPFCRLARWWTGRRSAGSADQAS